MKLLGRDRLATLSQQAAAAPRRRSNFNIHANLDDPVQRFFNAMQPGTYVRPHRHTDPPRWELFLVLSGEIVMLAFDDDGRVESRLELAAGGEHFGVELDAGRWHALAAVTPAVMFELKPGPYSAVTDKDFAAWAPAEGEPGSDALAAWYTTARVGDRFRGA